MDIDTPFNIVDSYDGSLRVQLADDGIQLPLPLQSVQQVLGYTGNLTPLSELTVGNQIAFLSRSDSCYAYRLPRGLGVDVGEHALSQNRHIGRCRPLDGSRHGSPDCA